MLLSVCAVLKDVGDLERISPFLGRATHAAFLGMIAHYDAAAAKELHDEEGRKAFTVSPLLHTPGEKPSKCYTRFTTFSPSLSQLFLEIVQAESPAHIDLDGQLIPVEAWCIEASQHVEATQTTYYELMGHWLSRRNPPTRITLKFLSPTTFRSRGRNMPLPLPHLVFGSLVEHWNALAPFALDSSIKTFVEESLAISGFRLRSDLVSIAGGKQVGFMGSCTYIATQNDPFPLASLNLLADFAFFSGVGAKTTMGMGQTRRVS
ncbi:MAG: CRISPR-associated endoribonuclease Cas6 [Syntrophomonadaceae bacterium]|nr:CRISPR-associated endoribonuclease Cas6 [Bacillota bacterium]MBT9146861.1 CRISPR-associated endoribonuclease Cas6 [Bacillota bacterium]